MEDEVLIQLFWERSENAIAETARQYGAFCVSIALNILGDTADAEECVSDAYWRLWNTIPPNRPDRLSAYLGRIVRNLSFNRYISKNSEKRRFGEMALVLDELAELIPDPSTPEDEYERHRLTEALNAFLAGLPSAKRKIFVCRYWYADSVKDIARRFGLTETGVSVTLTRIRKKLYVYLTERGFEV